MFPRSATIISHRLSYIYDTGVNLETYSNNFLPPICTPIVIEIKRKKKEEKEEKRKKIDKKRLIRKRERGRGGEKKKDINAEDDDNNKEDNKIYEIYVCVYVFRRV